MNYNPSHLIWSYIPQCPSHRKNPECKRYVYQRRAISGHHRASSRPVFKVLTGGDAGVKATSKEDAKEAARKNMNVLKPGISHMAEVFVPLLPAIICGGLIPGIVLGITLVSPQLMNACNIGKATPETWYFGLFAIQSNRIGVGGILGILSIKPQFWMVYLICILIAVIVPLVLTTIIYQRKQAKGELEEITDPEAEA